MAVPLNVCVAWPSTIASIPAGWTRETALDSRYILGAATGQNTDLATDRGNLTHIHTSPSHTPTQNAHTHSVHTDSNTSGSSVLGGALGGGVAADSTHGHSIDATSNSTTATNNSVAITVDAASNDLAYREVIWIKSDGTPTTLPSGCIAFFESDSLPSGWSRTNGDGYLKGASTGANGGATGGSNTHTHTSPAHTHTQNSHSHTATSTSGDASILKGTGGSNFSAPDHIHNLTLGPMTATNQSVTTTINSGNGEPPFKKLNTILASAPDLPSNIIALWLGTNAGIPSDWTRYTAMDGKWLKGAAANGESGIVTGGGSQHSHTASDCQPIQDPHTHTTTGPASGSTTGSSAGTSSFSPVAHTHSPWDTTIEIPTNNAVSVTIDDCSVDAALPKHRTVIYIQFTGTTPPPTRTSGVWTSYHLGLFDTGDPEAQILPEAAKRIAQSDLRYVPR